MSIGSLPSNMISEVCCPENLIQNFDSDIGVGVPVAMEEDGAGRFEDAVHFDYPFFEPVNIVAHAACPSVLEGADFAGVAPYNFVVAIGEEGRVEVDEVGGFAVEGAEDFEVITEDELVHRELLK